MKTARFWLVLMVLALCSKAVLAVPTLQLYGPDATYDPASESWVTTADPFELWVVGARTPDQIHMVDHLQLHIALPGFDQSWDWAGSPLNPAMTISTVVSSRGFFDKNPLPAWSLTLTEANLVWGRPSAMDLFTGNLPWHGVYPAWHWTISLPAVLDVDDKGEKAYNFNEDYDPSNPSAGGVDQYGDIQYYSISYSPYLPEIALHADLTGYAHNGWSRWRFAPFSHDAEGVYAPEPATLSLLAAGAAVAALMARRRRVA